MVERDDNRRRSDSIDDRIDAALERAMIGSEGSEMRQQWISDVLAWRQERKRSEAARDQRRTMFVGVGSSILVTVMTTLITWATGVLQWLSNISSPHR